MTTLVSQTHWNMCRLSCSYLKLVGPSSYANVATLFNQTRWHTCRLSCCHQTKSSEYKGTQSHRHRYHRSPQHIEGMPFRHKTRVLCRDNVSTQAHSYPDQLPRRFLSFTFQNGAVAFVDFRLCFFGHACTFCNFSSSFFFCLSLLSCILFILSSSFSFRFFSRSSRLMRFSLSSLSLWRLPFPCTFAVIFRMSLHKDIFLPTSSFCVLMRQCQCEDKMYPSITLDWCFGLELAAATDPLSW